MYNYYFNNVLFQYVTAVSDIFNEMSIINYNKEGKAIGWKPVPLTLAPKEKIIAELQADPTTPDTTPPNYLPRMSLVWNGIARNAERQRGKFEKRRILVEYVNEGGVEEPVAIRDVQTVPYDMKLELCIWTKYMTDMAQILENILPFFNPEAHISVYERGVGSERNAKITLDSVSPNFVTDISEPDRRVLQCNLNFTVECNFYLPQLPISKPIKRITVPIGIDRTPSHPKEPIVDGETLITFSVPPSGNDMSYLDMDRSLWWCVNEFDSNMSQYMGWTYHNKLDPQNPLPPSPPPV